nr:(Fe-S)-binding protein [Lysobacter sp. GX 14042]
MADRCVQCGLCLPACPTYSLERLEPQSPRGRIALARGWALDLVEPTAAGDRHLDDCLACRACEAVCPAGVQYGELLVAARGIQRGRRGAGTGQRVIEWLVARPRWLALLFGLYRRLGPLVPAAWRPLPVPPMPTRPMPGPAQATPPRAATGAPSTNVALPRRVQLFTGCVARAYEPPARAALVRLLAALGIAVDVPPDQTCCGALHSHAGNLQAADALAARNRSAFASPPSPTGAASAATTPILTLATGCHESVARAVSGRSFDALDFLDRHADRLAFAPLAERIALHLPCTQRNVVGSVPALRRLLARVPELQVLELDAGHGCCGAAGSAMLLDPQRADAFRQPLLDQLRASGATAVLSANIGCRLHLANGAAVPVQHPLELLADQLQAAPIRPPH